MGVGERRRHAIVFKASRRVHPLVLKKEGPGVGTDVLGNAVGGDEGGLTFANRDDLLGRGERQQFVKAPDAAPAEGLVSPGGPWREFRIPFVFSSNGRPYLRQLATRSGTWFCDLRNPENLGHALDGWYTPDGLVALLKRDEGRAHEQLKNEPFNYGFPLRHYQQAAIQAVEAAIGQGQREMLLAMATGTGKTKTCIALIYRLLKAHVLITSPAFLVISAADGDHTNTTAPNQLWQTGFTYLKVIGWGWFYFSTVLDDFSRYVIAWMAAGIEPRQSSTQSRKRPASCGTTRSLKICRRRLLQDAGPWALGW